LARPVVFTNGGVSVAKKKDDGEKKQGREVLRQITESLPCALTDRDRIELGLELARAEGEALDHEARAEAVKKDLASKKSEIQSRISSLATCIRNQVRYRDVSVFIYADFDSNSAIYVRQDTEEEIRRRALDASERQDVLDLPDDNDDDAPPPELPSGVSRAEE
jgi:hypothetical protein